MAARETFLCDTLVRQLFPLGKYYTGTVFTPETYYAIPGRTRQLNNGVWKNIHRINACYTRMCETSWTDEVVFSAMMYHVTTLKYFQLPLCVESSEFEYIIPYLNSKGDKYIISDYNEFLHCVWDSPAFLRSGMVCLNSGLLIHTDDYCIIVVHMCNTIISMLSGKPHPLPIQITGTVTAASP